MTRIRPAEPGDAAAIIAIHEAAIKDRGSEAYSDREVAGWLEPGEDSDGPDLDDPDMYWIVATVPAGQIPVDAAGLEADEGVDGRDDAQQVVGFGRLDIPEEEVTAVYVHPALDRHGVGSALLDALEAEAHSRGIESVRLWSSLNAAGFYDAMGYRRIEETTTDTTDEVTLDVIVFEKEL